MSWATPGGVARRLVVWLLAVLALLSVVAVAAGGAVYVRLARTVDERLSGRRWSLPSRIYSDEFLVYLGMDVVLTGLERRLDRLGYREVVGEPAIGGEMRRGVDEIEIALRPGGVGRSRTQRVRIRIFDGKIATIEDLDGGEELATATLEPEELTGIYREDLEDRRFVRVVDVPPLLVKAVLATEDARFFSHHGVDLIGVSRAAIANLRSGEVREGGSTLTQQLMKNFFLSSERTVERKATEMAMALVTEQRYSKMTILEAYLNEIYLGQKGARGIFGMGEASRFYFGKEPRDLELPEIALLAGLIRAPNGYSPFSTPDKALVRRNTVLRLLREANEIDETAYAEAVASPLGVVTQVASGADSAWFVDYVKSELATRYGEGALATEGLQIYTSLDPWLQENASRILGDGLRELERGHRKLARRATQDRLEAALVAVAPATGEIRALVGGRDYASSQFNRVTQALRQPGSAFKPIVYLAAFAAEGPGHLGPNSVVIDAPFTWHYDDKAWTPHNYGGRYRGSVTVRQAVEHSLNAAAARVARGVGLTRIVDLAHELGISSPLPRVPSLVLGAIEVTPLELTTAYTAFANGGARADLIAIKRVLSRDGDLLEGTPPTFTRVVEPEVAAELTQVLQGVLDRGTAHDARRRGFTRPAAGKTGTTNDYRDAWFVGYTPDLLTSVWVGFDHRSQLGLTGGEAALPIWTRFMTVATAADPPREFPGSADVRPRRKAPVDEGSEVDTTGDGSPDDSRDGATDGTRAESTEATGEPSPGASTESESGEPAAPRTDGDGLVPQTRGRRVEPEAAGGTGEPGRDGIHHAPPPAVAPRWDDEQDRPGSRPVDQPAGRPARHFDGEEQAPPEDLGGRDPLGASGSLAVGRCRQAGDVGQRHARAGTWIGTGEVTT